MATPVRLLLGLAVVCSVVPALPADCIWYGECNLDEKGFKQNCVYSGKAKKFTDAASIERLRGDCPSLFDENGDAYTCCDGNQAETLHSNMIKAAGVYSRCPSCFKNFFRIFCEMTCSPNQSDFIEIVSTQTNDDAKQYVTEINLFITENSMDKIYDSCKGVVMPQSGKYATDLTCGSYDSDSCTTKRWFEYMGEGNPFSPFTIKFTSTGGTFGDMTIVDIPSIACNESAGASSLACSCVDCPASCPASDNALFEPAEGNENVLVIVGVYTVILVTSASIAGRIYYRHRRRHRSKSTKGSYSSEDDQVSLTSNSHQKPRKVEVLGFKSEEFLENVFCCVGEACAKHPVLVFFLASWVLAVLIYPAPQIELVSTPIRLWASPYSQSLKNKDYFDQHFGPFYRAEQIFLKAVNLPKIHHTMMQGEVEFGPVFSREFLLKARELQLAIQDIGREDGLPLEEVCFAPLNNDFTGPVTVEKCTIATVWGYFQNSLEKFDQTGEKNGLPTNYLNVIYDCLQNSYDPACLAPYGGPAENLLVVGGFLNQANKTAIDSYALVLNFIVTNHLTDEENARAIEWEKKLIDFLLEWQKTEMPPWMDMAFMAERSIEDEIQRVSASSAGIIVLSYGIMLVYVAIALGRFSGWRRLLVDSKMGVALCGVGTVALSMLAAVGIFSYIRYPTILLTIEAVPFLVLAVGVDNLFILVDTHDRLLTEEKTGKPRPSVRRIGRTLGTAGPSMLLSSLAQEGCFLLGSLSEMPAVKSFALLAALALAINFVLQITVLMAVLALDERRKLSPRVDVMCCVRVQSCTAETVDGRLVKRFFESVLAPALMSRWTRRLVPVFFLCLLLAVVPLLPYVEVGLDQSLAMSKDSYVYKYFEFMKELLSIGPPVYFVVTKGLNYTATEHQNLVCGGIGCSPDSLSTAITAASKVSDLSHIARPASSWLDDLFDWTTLESCCKVFASNGSFCPHNRVAPECHTCSVTIDDLSRPSSADIRKFLPNFLLDIPDDDCAKGGIASYSAGVNFLLDKDGLATVGDTYFMGYHTPVRNSKEFYEALRAATKLCEKVEATINSRLDLPEPVRVFPYSVFYPFYEQYLTILKDTGVSLTYSMAMLFVAMTLLNGLDIVASAIVSSVVVVVLLELMAVMFMWGITLNAVSAVNLVVAMGIAVEFNAHIMHAFQKSTKGDRTARATEALVQTGSSVFSGIFLTKFSGIVVLYFAPIQILEVFYFRMYLSMVFLSAIHGLILLPVILSYIGPRVNRARVVKERQQRRENLLTTGHIS